MSLRTVVSDISRSSPWNVTVSAGTDPVCTCHFRKTVKLEQIPSFCWEGCPNCWNFPAQSEYTQPSPFDLFVKSITNSFYLKILFFCLKQKHNANLKALKPVKLDTEVRHHHLKKKNIKKKKSSCLKNVFSCVMNIITLHRNKQKLQNLD